MSYAHRQSANVSSPMAMHAAALVVMGAAVIAGIYNGCNRGSVRGRGGNKNYFGQGHAPNGRGGVKLSYHPPPTFLA